MSVLFHIIRSQALCILLLMISVNTLFLSTFGSVTRRYGRHLSFAISTDESIAQTTKTLLTERSGAFRSIIWSEEDVEKLQMLRAQNTPWPAVAEDLGRSQSACRQRYNNILKSEAWSPDVHKALMDLVSEVGEDWTSISAIIRKRHKQMPSVHSCRLHYIQSLRQFNIGPWSDDEKNFLGQVYKENCITKQFQPNWRNISHTLSRSSIDCRLTYSKVYLDKDLERVTDSWFEDELLRLETLVETNGPHWHSIGRELVKRILFSSLSFLFFPGFIRIILRVGMPCNATIATRIIFPV